MDKGKASKWSETKDLQAMGSDANASCPATPGDTKPLGTERGRCSCDDWV